MVHYHWPRTGRRRPRAGRRRSRSTGRPRTSIPMSLLVNLDTGMLVAPPPLYAGGTFEGTAVMFKANGFSSKTRAHRAADARPVSSTPRCPDVDRTGVLHGTARTPDRASVRSAPRSDRQVDDDRSRVRQPTMAAGARRRLRTRTQEGGPGEPAGASRSLHGRQAEHTGLVAGPPQHVEPPVDRSHIPGVVRAQGVKFFTAGSRSGAGAWGRRPAPQTSC